MACASAETPLVVAPKMGLALFVDVLSVPPGVVMVNPGNSCRR
jgi:hypothetical protein